MPAVKVKRSVLGQMAVGRILIKKYIDVANIDRKYSDEFDVKFVVSCR
jgi:hypothetical protein